jgi:AraC-like DNA-binding protein
MVVSLIRRWVDPRWAPALVWFEHPAPGGTVEIERILGCPVRFKSPTNTIWLDAGAAAQANPLGDPTAFQLFSWFAEQVGEAPRAAAPFTDQVVASIERCAKLGDAGIEPVARSLGLEARTLQRRLRAANTSFRELHERYRRKESFALLASSALTPKEIAHRLGYANPSAFIRAFRRWSPTTPARFRDERRGVSWPTW